ncbi:MAG TPA: acetyltransferase [Candidatus Binatia bacterium]|jgi:sugar O-acyltransferase (sialic acid O-acetyltransferase NeuD family)
MRHLVIGAAGHAQEVAWSLVEQARARGEDVEVLFFDDRLPPGDVACGLGPIVGGLDAVASHARGGDARLVMGIGMPRGKRVVAERLAGLGLEWTTVIHPRATVGPNTRIAPGSYVAAGAVLTVNVRIGRFVTINMHCQVAHDGQLDDLVTLHPDSHLAGSVTVGEGCELGTGAVVVPGVSIGAWAIVGAGGVVIDPLEGGRTYVGMPAAERRSRTQAENTPDGHSRLVTGHTR